ncbi:MAG: ISL3 family transposase [Prolixibacteraceae bacterium]|jgi:transposase
MRINHLINLPKFRINDIKHNNGKITIFASVKSIRSQCPLCGHSSSSVHDHYHRKIADLPVYQNTTLLFLKTRKFKCRNYSCPRKVFSEQTSHLKRYSRRTYRVSQLLDSLSIELTGKLGSQLSKLLYLPVSCSTVTRIALSQVLPAIKQPVILGVDDWAFRKGVNYGTVLIDMESSRPIDLLSSRDSANLKEWLKRYPAIKIITRDRSGAYSSAINEICPDAIQVADRFHLLMNLSEALDKYFKSISKEVHQVIRDKTDEILTLSDIEGQRESTDVTEYLDFKATASNLDAKHVDQRLDTYNKVKELQTKGTPINRISKTLRISRNTVRSYFIQETLSPRIHPKSVNVALFSGHILSRLNMEGYKKIDIFEEILGLGYNGGRTQAFDYINKLKLEYGITTLDNIELQQKIIPYVKPLDSRKLAKYIGGSISDIEDPDERSCMKTLIANLPELQIVRKLVQIFRTMIKRGCGNITRWIDFVKKSKRKFSGLKSFAYGLSRDIKAVENGIRLPWSNGTVEGHVNRIKSIKRQMYGRASFELLRRKVILSQNG